MTPGKILITVASKVPPVTAVAGPAQEVQIISTAGILVTPWGAGSPDSTAVPRQTQAEPLPGTQPATTKTGGLGRSGWVGVEGHVGEEEKRVEDSVEILSIGVWRASL